jgi:hypothetical protein
MGGIFWFLITRLWATLAHLRIAAEMGQHLCLQIPCRNRRAAGGNVASGAREDPTADRRRDVFRLPGARLDTTSLVTLQPNIHSGMNENTRR